jgi:hypothetical protein
LLPGIQAGYTSVGAVIGALAPELTASKAASSALSVAMGPVGLLGVAGLAAGGIALLTKGFIDYRESADAAKDATVNLENLLATLSSQGASRDLTTPLKDVSDAWGTLAAQAAKAETDYTNVVDQLVTANQTLEGATAGGDQTLFDQALANVNALEQERDALDRLRLSGDQIDEITKDIDELFKKPGIDAAKARQDLEWYFSLFESGQITAGKLVQYFDTSLSEWGTRYGSQAAVASSAQATLNAQMDIAVGIMNEMVRPLTQIPAMEKEIALAAAETSRALLGQKSATEAATANDFSKWAGGMETSFYAAITATNKWSADTATAFDAVKAAGRAQTDGAVAGFAQVAESAKASSEMVGKALDGEHQRVDAISAALSNYAQQLGQLPALADTHNAQIAQGISTAGNALGDAFRTVVGTNLGSQAGQVASWAKELIGVSGEYAKIDDLVGRGVISQTEYNRAQRAGTSIFQANARIQDDILKIQTDQSPLLAQLTQEQARYLDGLAKQPAQQQLIQLGYMDTAESAKALAAEQLAASAAAGELGKAGEENATKMITAAAEADPVLKAMLKDMGVISEGADGTITVNFDTVSGAKGEMQELIDKLGGFADAIVDAFQILINSNAPDRSGEVQTLQDQLNAIAGQYDISISTTYTTHGTPGGDTGGGVEVGSHALGGVAGYAGGGAVRAELAEYGPEMVRFSGGGAAMAWDRGVYDVPRGAYVNTAPATRSLEPLTAPKIELHLHVGGSVVGVSQITEHVTRELVPALVQAVNTHYQGHGVRT